MFGFARLQKCARWEQKVTRYMWSLCSVYPSSSMSTCICFNPSPLLQAEISPPELKLWMLLVCLALLSIRSSAFPLSWPPSVMWFLLNKSFKVQKVIWKRQGMPECLIPPNPLTETPAPPPPPPYGVNVWLCVHRVCTARSCLFGWLDPPAQRTNPVELVHSAATSLTRRHWPLKWLQTECLSPLQRLSTPPSPLLKVKVTHSELQLLVRRPMWPISAWTLIGLMKHLERLGAARAARTSAIMTFAAMWFDFSL